MGSCSGKVVPVDSPDNEAKPMEIDRVEGRGGWNQKGKGLKGQSLEGKEQRRSKESGKEQRQQIHGFRPECQV